MQSPGECSSYHMIRYIHYSSLQDLQFTIKGSIELVLSKMKDGQIDAAACGDGNIMQCLYDAVPASMKQMVRKWINNANGCMSKGFTGDYSQCQDYTDTLSQ